MGNLITNIQNNTIPKGYLFSISENMRSFLRASLVLLNDPYISLASGLLNNDSNATVENGCHRLEKLMDL